MNTRYDRRSTETNAADDVLYGHDLVARMNWLDEYETMPVEQLSDDTFVSEWEEESGLVCDEDECREYWALREFESDVGAATFRDESFIADHYFVDHARDLAESLGKDLDHWPYTCIDWGDAAQALQQDYSCTEFMGETFWWSA